MADVAADSDTGGHDVARMPKEMRLRIDDQDALVADELEKQIDAFMDGLRHTDADGGFAYDMEHPEVLTPAVLREIKRRYAGTQADGWTISHSEACPQELEFRPNASVSGRKFPGKLDFGG